MLGKSAVLDLFEVTALYKVNKVFDDSFVSIKKLLKMIMIIIVLKLK